MSKFLRRSIVTLFTIMMIAIVLVVLFAFEGTTFSCKQSFLMSQAAMLLCGAPAVMGVVGFAFLHERRAKRKRTPVLSVLLWGGFFGVLLLFQATCSYFSYFITGWDAYEVLKHAYGIGLYNSDQLNNAYFSEFPNNVPITLFFSFVIRLFAALTGGEPGMERCALVLILLMCVINTVTGMLTCIAARRMSGSPAFAKAAAVVYAAFIGISPWILIAYSDSVALLFPMLTLCLWQDALGAGEKTARRLMDMVGIGVAAGLGYLIKPQTLIVIIAIAIILFIRALQERRSSVLVKDMLCVLIPALLLAGPVYNAIEERSPFDINSERSVGALHFVMMGLREDSNGVYNAEDTMYSINAENKQIRTQNQLNTIKERLADYDAGRFLTHLKKKTLVNYADGTFAWGREGQFYKQYIEDKDGVISPLLKSWIDTSRKGRAPVMETYFQCIWIALLVFSALNVAAYRTLRKDRSGQDVLLTMMLSIIGLTLFELIFEARARYLYAYSPVYLLLGLSGIWYAVQALAGKIGAFFPEIRHND